MKHLSQNSAPNKPRSIFDSSFFTSGWYLIIIVAFIALGAIILGDFEPDNSPDAGACFGTQEIRVTSDASLNTLIEQHVAREDAIEVRSIRVSIFIEEPDTPTAFQKGDTVKLPISCQLDVVGSWDRGQ